MAFMIPNLTFSGGSARSDGKASGGIQNLSFNSPFSFASKGSSADATSKTSQSLERTPEFSALSGGGDQTMLIFGLVVLAAIVLWRS